jgi:mannose-6-phosphate isomerase-like protein (cupin superfamily)
LYNSKHIQLVLMSLRPGEEIGEEVHTENDQFFRIEGGHRKCIIDGNEYEIKDGDAIVIPSGAKHNVLNIDNQTDLKMYTLYAPPHHKDGTVRATKKKQRIMRQNLMGKLRNNCWETENSVNCISFLCCECHSSFLALEQHQFHNRSSMLHCSLKFMIMLWPKHLIIIIIRQILPILIGIDISKA